MNFTSNYVTVILNNNGDEDFAIKSIVAIPEKEWSIDYLEPKSVCVRKDGKCVEGIFHETQIAKKIELEQNNKILDIGTTPDGIYDKSAKFIFIGKGESTTDISSKVPKPGEYVFVVQYYQPDYPEFDLDVLVQNGRYYEAKAPMAHCPSNSGCRSLIRQADGNTRFQLIENFVITLKEDSGRGIWLDNILVIPAEHYNDDILKKLQFDQTKEFIKKCGNNHFHINTTEEGFCRDSVFSLTTDFNHGALPCDCNIDGAYSFECEQFGGQCYCKPNIIGRKCNICQTGFFGFPNCKPCNCPSAAVCEPERGACICPSRVIGEQCDQCEPGTYGYDPINGCEKCSCSPQGVLNGNLQCDLFDGTCSCKSNVVGRQCNKCKSGHYRFPYCERCNCDIQGTRPDICDQDSAECYCKDNVEGYRCDSCKVGMFNLQENNEKGCSECFCFGKTTRCSSAKLYKSSIMDMTNWDLVLLKDFEVEIMKNEPQEINGTSIIVQLRPADDVKEILYFAAPPPYLNKKLASYGGWLNYTIHYTTGLFGQAVPGTDIVIMGADISLYHRADEEPPSTVNYRASLQLVESKFRNRQGLPVTRDMLMMVLGDLRGIYIRATYWQPSLTVS